MKFYRMKNGDIVTNLHISTRRANALKGTRMWNAGINSLCCDTRVYFDGVEKRLGTAPTAVLLRQINERLESNADREYDPEDVAKSEAEKPWYEDLKNVIGRRFS